MCLPTCTNDANQLCQNDGQCAEGGRCEGGVSLKSRAEISSYWDVYGRSLEPIEHQLSHILTVGACAEDKIMWHMLDDNIPDRRNLRFLLINGWTPCPTSECMLENLRESTRGSDADTALFNAETRPFRFWSLGGDPRHGMLGHELYTEDEIAYVNEQLRTRRITPYASTREKRDVQREQLNKGRRSSVSNDH